MALFYYVKNHLGLVVDIIGLTTFLFSIGAWFHSRRVDKRHKAQLAKHEERIDIRLTDGRREIIVGSPRRKWLTRSELNGLLGLLPMSLGKETNMEKEKQPRYVLNSIDWTKVGKEIEKAQDGEASKLVVQCTPEELDQFDKNIIKEVSM